MTAGLTANSSTHTAVSTSQSDGPEPKNYTNWTVGLSWILKNRKILR